MGERTTDRIIAQYYGVRLYCVISSYEGQLIICESNEVNQILTQNSMISSAGYVHLKKSSHIT